MGLKRGVKECGGGMGSEGVGCKIGVRLGTNERASGVREYSVTHSLTLYSRLFLTHSYSFTVPSPVSITLSHLISFSLPLNQLFEDLDMRIRGEVVKK